MMHMQDMMKMNPFMSMMNRENPFAKTMEMWQKPFQMKEMDPMKMFSKMTEMFGWDKLMNNNSQMNGMETAVEVASSMTKTMEEMMRVKGEIIQENANRVFELMKEMWDSPTPENTMSKQTEFAKQSVENVMNDFKKLLDLYSKSNMESFQMMNGKLNESINKCAKMANAATAKAKKETA